MWKVALLLLVALGGFWFGFDRYTGARKKDVALNIYPEKQFPVSEHKSFVIVIYSYNQAQWSERCLRSVFEQEYDHYRIVFIDDHSTDGSLQKAKEFIADNNQEDKVTFLENKIKSGPITSLYRAVETCLDREIILPLDGKDWLSEENVLCKINSAYQNPDVWITLGSTIDYPTYEKKRDLHHSFYAALFKQIPLKDLYDSSDEQSYIIPIKTMS